MNRYLPFFCSLVIALAAGIGCGGKPPVKKAAPDKIQGKAQVLIESGGAMDAALNAGSPSSVYIWEGVRRYRLFFKTPYEVTHGNEYIVEGVYAQRVIDEIGDSDQGQNGYPLLASCRRVMTMAWDNLPMDAIDLKCLECLLREQTACSLLLSRVCDAANPRWEQDPGVGACRRVPVLRSLFMPATRCSPDAQGNLRHLPPRPGRQGDGVRRRYTRRRNLRDQGCTVGSKPGAEQRTVGERRLACPIGAYSPTSWTASPGDGNDQLRRMRLAALSLDWLECRCGYTR